MGHTWRENRISIQSDVYPLEFRLFFTARLDGERETETDSLASIEIVDTMSVN